jgi:Cu2+-exporting ATPase
MLEDFKRRFWISLIITLPIPILSPMIQSFLGLGDSIRFTGDLFVLFSFSYIVFFFGGYPFLIGLIDELKSANPGMMPLPSPRLTLAVLLVLGQTLL